MVTIDRLLVGKGGFDLDFENYAESITSGRLRQRINKAIYEPVQANMYVGLDYLQRARLRQLTYLRSI
jgi:hypothetical protein